MNNRFFGLAALIIGLIASFFFFIHPKINGTPVLSKTPAPQKKILLVPLDSRPPCRQFVADAALIDNIEIITPPSELLDYYYQEGNTKALADWLKSNFKDADAAVLSIDQLLHGGLIASREYKKNDNDAKNIITLLQELHKKQPSIPVYAFNILPRITPPPSIGGYSLWKDFIEFSRLTDELTLHYDEEKASRLAQLTNDLPQKDLAEYIARYDSNAILNKELAILVKNGVLKMLIVGQDDGEEFGIPNMKKRELKKYLETEKLSPEQVFITHGADEIAISLVAKISADAHNYTPRIYVAYNTPSTQDKLMPFMAGTVGETVKEKLQFLQAKEVSSPEQADFTFFVSCVNEETLSTRLTSANHLKSAIAAGQSISLVDLSENFTSEETIFPFLVKNNTPLHSLISYAGWNTTSNAVGTAIAQSVLFCSAKKDAKTKTDVINTVRTNIAFLDNRFLEDYFFLKDISEQINFNLQKAGYIFVNDLDLEHNYQWANAMLQKGINERFDNLRHTKAFRTPVTFSTPDGTVTLAVNNLTIDTCFPWPRTFEIYLRTTPSVIEIKP